MRHYLTTCALALCLLMLAGCSQRGSRKAPSETVRSFPVPELPAMLTGSAGRAEYLAAHYWDGFLSGSGRTDAEYLLGVPRKEVEGNVSTFIAVLEMLPVPRAQELVGALFSGIEAVQAADPSSTFYLQMTEMVSDYLYDPNSPMRSEDLYLPFVRGLASSRFTSDDRRTGYLFEERMCSLNPYGSVAPDFVFKDIRGRSHRLHEVEADFLLLFFSNPGCHACKEIIDQIEEARWLAPLMGEGRVAVVNVYIDEDLAAWREYEHNYPRSWVSGYDPGQVINGGLYYVRAIPSLYLLDSGKRVVFKDVPVEKALAYINNEINQKQ